MDGPNVMISMGIPMQIWRSLARSGLEYPKSKNTNRNGIPVCSIMERAQGITLLKRSRGTTTMVTCSYIIPHFTGIQRSITGLQVLPATKGCEQKPYFFCGRVADIRCANQAGRLRSDGRIHVYTRLPGPGRPEAADWHAGGGEAEQEGDPCHSQQPV